MHPRSLFLPLLAVIAAAVALTPAPAHGAAKRVVVSPRAGQVVEWHHVRLRVRSRSLDDTLRVRLNGMQVGDDFGRPRRGVRTLRASLSHGLRRGRNVLRVTVRPHRGAARRAKLRFRVRTKRHLVGAGRDRAIAIRGKVRLRGAVRRATPRAAGTKLRWKLIDGPRRGGARAATAAATSPPARLTATAGPTAGFRPTVPGDYTLRLTAGSGRQTASDTVILSATPRSKLVPIETMTTVPDPNGAIPAIRVGDKNYLVNSGGADNAGFLQILVLQRDTLEFVTNTTYPSVDAADDDLSRLDASKLVILVLQPQRYLCCSYSGLEKVGGRIGVPDYAFLPKLPGTVSAIGVPGMARGDADVNVVPEHSGRVGSMKGYLTPDQYGEFGFVPSERVPFTFEPKPSDPCTPANNGGQPCDDRVGFRVGHLDSRTGAPAAHDGAIYSTNGRNLDDGQKEAEAARMAADLAAFPPENVATIETVSNRRPGEAQYRPPIGRISRATMTRLANEVQLIGGTRNAFNRIALAPGSVASGGLTYALVGWKIAGEGNGAEVAAGVDDAGEAPTLSGMLRPDRESRFRPVPADPEPEALTNVVMDEPTTKWPLDDDAGAKRALSWLGSTDDQVGSDPRAEYANSLRDKTDWKVAADKLAKVDYPDGAEFTEEDFRTARAQLILEMGWVGNVRSYLSKLASPIADSTLMSYTKAHDIARTVYQEAKPPDDSGALHWIEFASMLLELGAPIPEFGEVTETVASVMELGVWMAGAEDESGKSYEEFQFKADELGTKLTEEMAKVVKTYTSMGDVIVTDPEKLEYVGKHGDCSPTARVCPEGYRFGSDEAKRVSADIQRTVERTAYDELLPLGFATYGLEQARLDRAPDPRWYRCGVFHPWSYYSDLAVSTATTPLLLELDPQSPGGSLWKLLVLSRPNSGWDNYGTPPSDKTLRRLFGKVVDTTTPGDGGLGASSFRLMSATKWNAHFFGSGTVCS